MYLSWDFEMQFYDHIVAKNYLGYISGQVTVLMQKSHIIITIYI